MNTDLVISLAIALLSHATELQQLILNARAQNRDITDAELNAVFAKDAASRAKLAADIVKAKAEGR